MSREFDNPEITPRRRSISPSGKAAKSRSTTWPLEFDEAMTKYAKDNETTVSESIRRLVSEGLEKRGYYTGEPIRRPMDRTR